ncbi:hypothetical protein HY993_01505 [Candidatus Micrarchaeota archaeon]|nr:hypothetical protein [Candidatus Micrarchaeota archaeon]
MKPALHFGVYHAAGNNSHAFTLFTGRKQFFEKKIQEDNVGLSLVGTKRVPEKFAEEIRQLFGDGEKQVMNGLINYIVYDGHIASSVIYRPKGNLSWLPREKRFLPGLGYFLERECLKHFLRNPRFGITHASTGISPNERRKKQLEKVGSPIRTAVPIREWIKRLEKGIELSRKKTRVKAP